ncbi:MAG: response regulator [Actinobacteria bacterium]|nr:response regulator [Actinomycetota bacterium]MBW3649126.1 response regulator [Actinomycetota bacterium]
MTSSGERVDTARTAGAVPVLVVDDRPENLLAVEAVLEPLDLRILRANSGAEALRHLLVQDVAVILLDVQMPELDGFETARLIKARARTSNIPIIFLTALNREVEHQLEGYGTGAVDYLAKPFEPDVLRTKVAVFANLYRQSKTIEDQRQMLERRLEERDRAEAALRAQTVELERSNAELERFAFVASHDLREPLQVVEGFLDLVQARHARGGEEAVALVARARGGIQAMTALVDELLTYAKASAAEQHLEPVDLAWLFDHVRAEMGPDIDAASAVVTVDPLPVVRGDRWQLGRLLAHLLQNALKFRRGDRSEVHVGLSRREGQWVVSVRDDGIGIDPAEVPRLFTIFGRLHPRESYAGAGLGLAFCRRVVERHGGQIWLESLPGRGTTVSFTLPVTTEEG